MADSFVQLPDDATNTGKKIRTVTRVVGANTVHEHFFIIQDPVNDVQLRVYTEGDTVATVAGFAPLMEVAANELRPIQGAVADGLLVNLGSNNDVTVTGSVTANAGTNLNTSLLALESGGNLAGAATSLAIIDDWDETDRAKVNIIVGQAGITAGAGAVATNTPRVTHASDDPAVTALQAIDAGTPAALGQTTMANSMPVVIASNQSTVPVSVSAGITVEGKIAEGVSAAGANPVLVAGENNSGNVTNLNLDSLGGLVVSARAVLTASAPTAVSVGVASTSVLALNASRKGLVLTNTSSAVISIGINNAAVLNSGITLLPYGVWEMGGETFSTAAINAIAAAAASNLSVQEFT